MNLPLRPAHTEADILPAYRHTPIGDLLRYQNLGAAHSVHEKPTLLIVSCLEQRAALRVPEGFAISLRTAGASLKRDPFKVSFAIGLAGISTIALVAHDDCQLGKLGDRRAAFIEGMIELGGWEEAAAAQHFDHWSDLFAVDDPVAFVVGEAARVQSRYPKILVAPLLYASSSGILHQVARG